MERDLAKIAESVRARCPEAEVRADGMAVVAGPLVVMDTTSGLWLGVGVSGCVLTPARVAVLRAVLDACEAQMEAADGA